MFLLIVNSRLFLCWLHKKWVFALLYDAYAPALYGWITNILSDNKSLADEVLKSVFVTAYKTLGSYDRRKQRLFIWLLNMTRNMTLAAMCQLDEWPSATRLEDISGGLREILQYMDEGPRRVFELMYYKQYSKAEVSRAMNISMNTTDALFQEAMERLQMYLNSNL